MSAAEENGPEEGDPEANTTIDVFGDGSIRFVPPHTKDDAAYRTPNRRSFDPSHDRCGSCVHYIANGGCHFVQGNIDPEAYCERFYADYGVFAHDHGDEMEVNAELVGENLHPDRAVIEGFVAEIEERLQERERMERFSVPQVQQRLLDLERSRKQRRVTNPRPDDDWPGSWEVFEDAMTRLPSWHNDDGNIIRVDTSRPSGPLGFVHVGGRERWEPEFVDELHDQMVEYMAANPGG